MKRVVALVLAGIMTLGLSTVSFAASQKGQISTGSQLVTAEKSKDSSDFYLSVLPTDDGKTYDQGLPEIYTWGEEKSEPRSQIKVAIVPGVVKNDGTLDTSEGIYKITSISTHVTSKNVTASVRKNDGTLYKEGTPPVVTIKAKAGVRDFELEDYEVDVDLTIGRLNGNKIEDKEDITITLQKEDGVAYSISREVYSGDNYSITKSRGSIFDFNEVLDEQVRIRCNDFVDVFFKGNYGTDRENMRVVTDEIAEVSKALGDRDVDYYDFVGTPKFASKVKVVIDADPNSYLYEYDKKTGTLTKVAANYESDGWAFTTKNLGTYIVTEEAYTKTSSK